MQDQVFHVRRQREVSGRENRVVALAGALVHRVAGIVDEIDVVAGTAAHGVGAGAAVEEVVAGIAEDRVGQAVAVALQVGAALQDQVFHVRRQREVGGREDRVVALAGALDHRVAGIVDEIDVVAGTAAHGVGAGAAVEQIVAGVAEERVRQAVAVALQVGAALQDQVFHVRRQREVGRREHRVVALAGVLDRPRRRHCRRSRSSVARRRPPSWLSPRPPIMMSSAAIEHIVADAAEQGLAALAPMIMSSPAPPSRVRVIAPRGKLEASMRVIAGAAIDDHWSPLSALKMATGAELAGDADDAGVREDSDHLVAGRAVDRHPVHRAVAAARRARRRDRHGRQPTVTSVPVRSLITMLSAPPSAWNLINSTSLRSMVTLAMSRVKRTRPPLAEMSMFSAMLAPLKSSGRRRPGPRRVVVVARVPLEHVVAGAQEGGVVARLPSTKSLPSPPFKRSAPCAAEQDVVACTAVKGELR